MDSERISTDVNDVAPHSLAHMIGNDKVRRSLQVALDYAQTEGTAFPATMLLGGPGCGKSSIAALIAREMAADYIEVIGQSITSTADMNHLLLSATDKSVICIDEAHELSPRDQTTLYLALDKKTVFINAGGRTPQAIKLANFSLVLATSEEFALLSPIRDRMRLVCRLSYLSVAELARVVLYRSRALGWDVHEAVLHMVAQRAKGTPRLALRILQSCRRVCRAEGDNTITPKHLETACELDQLDTLGLDATEQEYLRILAEGPARLHVVASRIGLPVQTIQRVTEVTLIRLDLVGKTANGQRELTAKGREHLVAQLSP
jgi:Holliday junction DNA helicase RuvB